MTIDESLSHRAEMLAAMERQEADDRAQRHAEYLERDLCESEEAVLAHWRGVMAARPTDGTWDVPDLPHTGIDNRLHSVNGERPA